MSEKSIGLIELGSLVESLANDQSEWSQRTFGTDREHGPIGALKHLALEAQECIESPNDVMEYADCLLLIIDASRRAGFTYLQLFQAGRDKLEVCQKRVYPKPNGDEPSMHIKESKS